MNIKRVSFYFSPFFFTIQHNARSHGLYTLAAHGLMVNAKMFGKDDE